MRNLVLIFFFLVLGAAAYDHYCQLTHQPPLEQMLQEAIESARLSVYRNADYGFKAEYPEFFCSESDAEGSFTGRARFSYWNSMVHVNLETSVRRNGRALNVRDSMHFIAASTHAATQRMGTNWFVVAGPLYEDGVPVEGYSFYDKYVCVGKLWFVYSLTYPDACRASLARLFRLVDRFSV